MKRKFTFLIAAALMLLTMVATTSEMWGQSRTTTDILTLDCVTPAPTGTTSTALSNTSDIATFLNSAAGLSNAENKITCSDKTGDVYKGKGSGGGNIPQQCLKVGKASGGGGFTFTIPDNYDEIDVVEITCYGWKTTSSISLNSGTAQTFTTAQVETTKTFELASSTRTITLSVTASAVCITEIVLKKNDTETVTTPTITPNGGSFIDSQEITLSCNTEEATIYYTLDGNNPTTSSTVYSTPFTITETKTVKAYAVKDGLTDSNIADATFTKVTPMTVAEALAASPTNYVYVTGIISTITEVNTGYHNATYRISDDGTTTSEMIVYRGRYLNNTDFTSEDQIQIGDVVVVTGNITTYNDVNQLAQGNYLISLIRPEKVATPTFTPAAGTYNEAQNITVTCATEEASIFYKLTENGDWTEYTAAIPVATTTTIWAKATKEGMVDSDVASAAYVINTEPTITVDPATVNAPYAGADGTLTVTYENITEIIADVWFCNADGTEDATYDWITADINAQNNVAYLVEENDGAARTAYFKVYALDDESNDVYSNLVTVTQAAYIVDYATLPFEWAGGTKEDLLALTGVTGNGLGSNYAESNAPYRVKFDTDGDYIIVKTNEQPGVVTIGIKKLGGANASSIIIKGSSNGEDFTTIQTFDNEGAANAVLEHETTVSFDENDRYVMIYFNKPSGGSNVGVGPITIAQVNNTPSITINPGPYNLNANGGDAELPVTYNNMPNDPQAEVVFFESNGETPLGENPTWITATINNAGNVDGHIDANTGAARSAYFKVKGIDANDNAVYSDLVTINQAAYVLSIEFETASIDLAAGGESDRKLSFEYSGLGNDPEFSVNRYESDGTTPATYDWLTTEITDGNKVSITVTANTGAARTAYFKVYGLGSVASTESNLVTVNQAAAAQEVTYTLITDINDLTPGYHYLIASEATLDKLDIMDEQKSNNRGAKSVDVNNGTITLTNDYYDFVISGYENHWTIYDESYNQGNGGFLYAASSGSNYLKTRAANSDGNSEWSIAIDNEGVATLVAQGNYTRNTMQYNSSSSIFACYSSASQSAVYLYKKTTDTPVYYSPTEITVNNPNTSTYPITVQNNEILELTGKVTATDPANLIIEDGGQLIHNGNVTATLKKNVAGYNTRSVSGWYTIASPVADMAVSCATTGDYDFFAFNEENTKWLNQKVGANNITNFEQGVGYLYANADATVIDYLGTLIGTETEVTKPLSYACENASYQGINLMGNPFSRNLVAGDIEIDGTPVTTYYTVEGGNELTTKTLASTPIKPGQGFMVQATASSQNLVFNPSSKDRDAAKVGYITIVAGNNENTDNAFVQVGGGNTLRKMTLSDNSSVVYVMNNGNDYAAATIDALEGSMPVCFKANALGSYTITIEAIDINADYLHLIDNFTGEDINLLLEPSYSFIASNGDRAERFTLVFRSNGSEGTTNDIFAYQNNNDIIVNGEGELQVFDVTGRMVATQHVNGVQTVNVPSQGVFIFKLNEKTQKIVVR